jgi:phage terminase small subunit
MYTDIRRDRTLTNKPKLTQKQAKFVKGIAEGKTNTQAAIDAYEIESLDKDNVGSSIAAENLRKPTIQEAIELARVKLNITPERVLKPIDDALNSDDLEMRLKGSDRALKVMGVGQKKDSTTVNNFGNLLMQQRGKYDD